MIGGGLGLGVHAWLCRTLSGSRSGSDWRQNVRMRIRETTTASLALDSAVNSAGKSSVDVSRSTSAAVSAFDACSNVASALLYSRSRTNTGQSESVSTAVPSQETHTGADIHVSCRRGCLRPAEEPSAANGMDLALNTARGAPAVWCAAFLFLCGGGFLDVAFVRSVPRSRCGLFDTVRYRRGRCLVAEATEHSSCQPFSGFAPAQVTSQAGDVSQQWSGVGSSTPRNPRPRPDL